VLDEVSHAKSTNPNRSAAIQERDGPTRGALDSVVQKLEQLIKPGTSIRSTPVQFLLPEGSGNFVLNYPFVAET
jgi:hypothetical protein